MPAGARAARAALVVWLVVFGASTAVTGAPPPVPIAFVHANVLTMDDRESVLPGQTVVVEGGRIAALGPDGSVVVPDGATVIDASGRFLVPGLVDSHVHLDRHVGARPDFGDAPLFLAYGVTTVVNLRGEPEHLAVRDRIAAGDLLAPTLLTSGEFINEPRISTAEEAEREVTSQRAAGFDLIKFREVIDFERHRTATTVGLGRPAYLRLNEAARAVGMPLVGHHPFNLDLASLLEARQSLAHLNELANLHFLPPLNLRSGGWMALVRWSWLALAAVLAALGAGALMPRARGGAIGLRSTGALGPGFSAAAAALTGAALWVLVVPPGLYFGNVSLLVAVSAVGLILLTAVATLLLRCGRAWLSGGVPLGRRVALAAVVLPALGVLAAAVHWVPFAWRGAPSSIARVARACKQAGISIQTTMICQETFFAARDGYRIPEQLAAPELRLLQPELRQAWSRFPGIQGWQARLWRRHPEFLRTLAAALAEEGVPLLAGTDALGVPLVVPGVSLHRELRLLSEAGLSPAAVLRSATTAPAAFLNREADFGRIAVGARADLLLVAGNPLDDLTVLERPLGVMVRGIWLPRERLDALLEPLLTSRESSVDS